MNNLLNLIEKIVSCIEELIFKAFSWGRIIFIGMSNINCRIIEWPYCYENDYGYGYGNWLKWLKW